MNGRYLISLYLGLGMVLFPACSGDASTTKPSDTTTTGDDDDDDSVTETASTGVVNVFFDPAIITWSGQFGFDSDTVSLVPVGTPYGEIGPTIDIYIGDETWEGAGFSFSATASYCQISLPLDNATFAPWALTANQYYGVDYNAGDEPGSDCHTPGYEFNEKLWGPDPVGDIVALGAWGVAVGPLHADLAGLPEFQSFISGYEDVIFGGRMIIPLFGGATLEENAEDNIFTLAYTIDGSFYYDGTTTGPINAIDVWTGAALATGWYQPSGFYLYGYGY